MRFSIDRIKSGQISSFDSQSRAKKNRLIISIHSRLNRVNSIISIVTILSVKSSIEVNTAVDETV